MTFDDGIQSIQFYMTVLLVLWMWLVMICTRRMQLRGSVGLVAGMLFTMTFLYGGAFVYTVPGYTHYRADAHWYLNIQKFTEVMVLKGTAVSVLGLLGFAIGVGAFLPARTIRRDPVLSAQTPVLNPLATRTILVFLGSVGGVSFVVHSLDLSFPLSGAMIEVGRNIGVAFLCLGMLLAKQQGKSLVPWLLACTFIPIYYVVGFGFASYGFMFGCIILAFWMTQLRSSKNLWKARLLIALGVYLALTGFVGWFSFRDEVRYLVWDEGSGSLLDTLGQAITETSFFSLGDFQSLDLVNIRLNLPFYIGLMMDQHDYVPELRQYGTTLIILPLVFLPRAFWSDKPTRGGSDFMNDHTGLNLSEETTFGTGTVFEFYANFAYLGVFVGFIVFGYILARIDIAAGRHLRAGRYMDFARLFVVGLVAVDPLARPFFIVNGAAFAWIFMSGLKFLIAWSTPPIPIQGPDPDDPPDDRDVLPAPPRAGQSVAEPAVGTATNTARRRVP